MSLYVGNLSFEVGQEDLSSVFAEYGSVKRVQLPTDRETGRPRGFGFVEMGTEAEENAAIESIWDLSVCEPCEHKSNETEIELCSGIAEGSLKVFD
jgi:hypothetical protein